MLKRRYLERGPSYFARLVRWSRILAVDVEWSVHRAELLRRAVVLAVPVVAGKAVLPEAGSRARELRVWQLMDGQVVTPES